MNIDSKEKIVEAATSAVGNAAGEIAGSSIGAVIAGPSGAIVGAAAGGIIQSLFSWIGNEIQERYLSKKEKERISQVIDLAYKKITENKYAGKKFRESSFFESHESNRSNAEELLEGILLAAQREYEERKIPYIANLYGNLCFAEGISLEVANSLLKFASELSYQELAVLHCVALLQTCPQIIKKPAYKSVTGLENVSIATDTFHLYSIGLIHTVNSNILLSAGGIDPSNLKIEGLGRFLFLNMELVEMPHDELMKKVFSFFSISPLPTMEK